MAQAKVAGWPPAIFSFRGAGGEAPSGRPGAGGLRLERGGVQQLVERWLAVPGMCFGAMEVIYATTSGICMFCPFNIYIYIRVILNLVVHQHPYLRKTDLETPLTASTVHWHRPPSNLCPPS